MLRDLFFRAGWMEALLRRLSVGVPFWIGVSIWGGWLTTYWWTSFLFFAIAALYFYAGWEGFRADYVRLRARLIVSKEMMRNSGPDMPVPTSADTTKEFLVKVLRWQTARIDEVTEQILNKTWEGK